MLAAFASQGPRAKEAAVALMRLVEEGRIYALEAIAGCADVGEGLRFQRSRIADLVVDLLTRHPDEAEARALVRLAANARAGLWVRETILIALVRARESSDGQEAAALSRVIARALPALKEAVLDEKSRIRPDVLMVLTAYLSPAIIEPCEELIPAVQRGLAARDPSLMLVGLKYLRVLAERRSAASRAALVEISGGGSASVYDAVLFDGKQIVEPRKIEILRIFELLLRERPIPVLIERLRDLSSAGGPMGRLAERVLERSAGPDKRAEPFE